MAESADSKAAELGCLFSLPGELRNRIYRHVLVQSGKIFANPYVDVNANGYSRPGLLSTCKAIRAEALQIYYYENTFRLSIENFDSTPLVNWKTQEKVMTLCPKKLSLGVVSPQRHGQASWPNLLLWLRHLHERKTVHGMASPQTLLAAGIGDLAKHLLGSLFATVRELRDQPWARVEKHILNLRPSLIAIDEAFAKD